MKEETQTAYSGLAFERGRDTPTVVLLLSILTERAITLSYYHLETNTLVLSMGRWNWSILTAGCVIGILVIWYTGGYQDTANRILVYLLTLIHAVAVVTNAAVILFV